MDGQRQVGGGSTHFDGQGCLADEIAGTVADDVHTQEQAAFSVGNDLRETVRVQVGDCASERRERELSDFHLVAALFRLFRGEAGTGNFRIGKHDRRNDLRIHGGRLAGDDLCRNFAFARALVRQHGLAGHVADGKDRGDVGAHFAIDRDETADRFDARDFQAKVLDVGSATDGDQNLVGLQLDGFAVALDGEYGVAALFGHALGFRADEDVDPELLRLARNHLHALGVAARQDAGQRFDESNLAAELRVEGSDFHANVAAAHDDQPCRQFAEGQRAGRIHDAIVVEGQTGNGDWARAGSDDDIFRFDHGFVLRIGTSHPYGARRQQRRRALQVVAAVGLEELLDARGEL